MKTIFTFLFLAPFCLFAQQNSWFETGSLWVYNYGIMSEPEHYQATFGITQTIFADKLCFEMDIDNFPFLCSPVSPPYYFYESNDSIYFATEVDSTFRMVYNFNAVPGDTWIHTIPIEFNNSYQPLLVEVVAVNEVSIDGMIVNELILSYSNPFMPPPQLDFYTQEISVLEYIGATSGFFIPLGSIPACDNETDIKLQCFGSPSLIYTNPEFGSCFLSASAAPDPIELKFYPNPAREYLTIDIDFAGASTLKITQLDGKTVFIENINSGLANIELPALSAGMYVVEVSNAEVRHFGKLQIE
ncbi:T9SS type A sorting domain-containing protein [Cryomorpha ignava]|uniref:T9SS type A sorting domain-containing protein n=1 Tax=Cryomorpha ignava TaxID=101383 RepID=A0A7K3WM67_9FLAO|nr:T9SS type A sorting domain-containing protein [Cryomorpha ignava]NEN22743.1 T9SS type A sorting domain-containing protein [Cryomorpha ignava]